MWPAAIFIGINTAKQVKQQLFICHILDPTALHQQKTLSVGKDPTIKIRLSLCYGLHYLLYNHNIYHTNYPSEQLCDEMAHPFSTCPDQAKCHTHNTAHEDQRDSNVCG